MKNMLIALLLLSSLTAQADDPYSNLGRGALRFDSATYADIQPPKTACQSQVILAMAAPAGRVLCCCETYTGSCCKWVDFCGGFILGCFCN